MNRNEPYKIVVAEDEPPILNNLVHKLETLDLPIRVVGSAADGAEAKRVIERESPNIVITDIRMPELDGLELCRWLSQERPEIKTIVLSGYGEFEYAQAAIHYRVSSYLLKPVNSVKLRDTLEKVCADLDLRLRTAQRQSLVQRLSGGVEGKELPFQFAGDHFTLYLICIGNLLDSGGGPEDFDRCQKLWQRADMDAFLAGETLQYWWLLEEKNPNERMLLTVEALPDLSQRLYAYLGKQLSGTCCVNLCGVEESVPLEEIWNTARRMRAVLRHRLAPCRSGRFSLGDEGWPELTGTAWKALFQAGHGRQGAQLRPLLHTYLEERRGKVIPQTALEEALREVLATLSEQRREGAGFPTECYRDCCREIARATGEETLYPALETRLTAAFTDAAASGLPAEQLAFSVRDYLEKNYRQEVTMDTLADKFHFSESYIARLFRSKFGVPPVKYLLRLRMPTCTHCHQPQTAAQVICSECYRALTERTVTMEHDKLIEALTYRANQGGYVALRSDESVSDICGECPWTECNKKMDFGWCVFELLQRAADALKAKDAQLAEKDKQLAYQWRRVAHCLGGGNTEDGVRMAFARFMDKSESCSVCSVLP